MVSNHRRLSPAEEEANLTLTGKLPEAKPLVTHLAEPVRAEQPTNEPLAPKAVWPRLNPHLPEDVEYALHQALALGLRGNMSRIKAAVIAVIMLNGDGARFNVVYNNWTEESKGLVVASKYIQEDKVLSTPLWGWQTDGQGKPLPHPYPLPRA